MCVNKLVLNFHQFIKDSIAASTGDELCYGSDEWDDLTEQKFEEMVLAKIEKKTGRTMQGLYGAFSEAITDKHNSVLVQVRRKSKIFKGRHLGNTTEWEEVVLDNDHVFIFCMFFYPFTHEFEFDILLQYVIGESDDGLTQTCALLKDCHFFVED